MTLPSYQFVVLSASQFDHLKNDLDWDIGAPRTGPDGSQLTNRNGNVPFTEEEVAVLDSLGVAIIWNYEIDEWLSNNGWEES